MGVRVLVSERKLHNKLLRREISCACGSFQRLGNLKFVECHKGPFSVEATMGYSRDSARILTQGTFLPKNC